MKSLTNVNSPNLRQALRTIVKAYNLLLSKLTPDLQVVVRTRPRLTIYVKKKPTRTPSIYVARIWKIVKILAEIAKRLPPEKIAQWVGGIVITTETGGKLIFKQGWERPLPPLAALIKEFLPRFALRVQNPHSMPRWLERIYEEVAKTCREPYELVEIYALLKQFENQLRLGKVGGGLSKTVKYFLEGTLFKEVEKGGLSEEEREVLLK